MRTPLITIGMATYDDYYGVYSTIQALRMYHPICSTPGVEFIVIDNNPDSRHGREVKSFVEGQVRNGRYIPHTAKVSTSVRNQVFAYSQSEIVLCMDCHVMLQPGSLEALVEYFMTPGNQRDIVSGPLLYDDLRNVSTHFQPGWSNQMYGTWATDPRVHLNQPFEIPMNGCGLFSMMRDSWPQFNPHFVGFGGEEWYIQEKVRQRGGRAVCIPALKWNHRFGRPDGVHYPNTFEDRVFNYYVGWLELYKDPTHEMVRSITQHFSLVMSTKQLDEIFVRAQQAMGITPV